MFLQSLKSVKLFVKDILMSNISFTLGLLNETYMLSQSLKSVKLCFSFFLIFLSFYVQHLNYLIWMVCAELSDILTPKPTQALDDHQPYCRHDL